MSQVDQASWRRVLRPARSSLPLVLAIAVVAGAVTGVHTWLDTRHATHRTAVALDGTRAELAEARSDLAVANEQVAAVRRTLDGEQWTFGARQDERDAAEETLASTSALLTELQAQLAAARVQLGDDTARLDALDRCLIGVAEALNQASVGDTDGMASTLDGIEATCAEARVEL